MLALSNWSGYMSRSSGGSIGEMMRDLVGRSRQRTLEADPLYRKAQGLPTQKSQNTGGQRGQFRGRVMRRRGILEQANHA